MLRNTLTCILTHMYPEVAGDPPFSYLWLVGNEGTEKKMETTTMGYIGTAVKDSFLHS